MKATEILSIRRSVKRGLDGNKRIPRKKKKFLKSLSLNSGKQITYMFERAVRLAHKKETAFGKITDEMIKTTRSLIDGIQVNYSCDKIYIIDNK